MWFVEIELPGLHNTVAQQQKFHLADVATIPAVSFSNIKSFLPSARVIQTDGVRILAWD